MASPVRKFAERGQKRDKTSAGSVLTPERMAALKEALNRLYDVWSRSHRALTAARRATAFANAMNDAAADLKLNPGNKDSIDERTLKAALNGASRPQYRTFQCIRRVLFPAVTDGSGTTEDDEVWRALTRIYQAQAESGDQETIARWQTVSSRKVASLSDDSQPEFSINWKQARARPFDDELVHFRLHPPLPSNQPGDRHDILATLDFGSIERTADTSPVVVALRAAHLNIPAASYQVAMNKMPGEEGNAIPGFAKKAGGAIIRPPAGVEFLDGPVVPGGRLTEVEPGPENAGPVTFTICAARQDIHIEAVKIDPGSTHEEWAKNNREKALKILILDQCHTDSSGRPILAQISLDRKSV